jgi:enoyl-CoA hydratase
MLYQYLKVEMCDDGAIMGIPSDRPAERNAQNWGLLVELDKAFAEA